MYLTYSWVLRAESCLPNLSGNMCLTTLINRARGLEEVDHRCASLIALVVSCIGSSAVRWSPREKNVGWHLVPWKSMVSRDNDDQSS